MNLSDMREKRTQLFANATSVKTEGEFTPETRAKFDAITAEIDALDEDIKRAERIEAMESENRSRGGRVNPGASEDEESRKAFRNYLVTGETRDLTLGTSGIVVPQLFNKQIIDAKASYGEIYNIVNVLTTETGNPIKIPTSNDTSNGLVAVTVGTDAASNVDPTMSSLTLQVDNFTTGVIKVDRGLLKDSGFDIESWLKDKFLQRFYRGASSLIVNGNSGSVASLASAYNTGITTGTVATLKYADLVNAMVALDPAYSANAVWAMNNNTLGVILSITDTAGRPVFLPDYGSAANGFVGTILGRPVKLVTQLPNVATGNVPVLFGDFNQGYTFRQQAPGVEIMRLDERYAAGYEVGFVGFARVGGVATKAGVNPIVGITIK